MNSRLGISLQLLFALGQMPIFSDNNLVRCNGRDFAAIGRQENGMRISRYFFLILFGWRCFACLSLES